MKFTKRVKVKALGAFGEKQKGNRMGVTKHFVQEKSDSKQVKLRTESNDVGLAADPKYPISRLSKFDVGKMERTWLTSEMESEERQT
jgi:hypothetical protein